MQPKAPNYTTFNKPVKQSAAILEKLSSADAKKHVEYGTIPYNAPCINCAELLDKRTQGSRLFIDVNNEAHTYSQQSYFPLHYKANNNDAWRTIDPLLQSMGNNVYAAPNQPIPTKCDLNNKSTSLVLGGFEFEFSKDLTLYFYTENAASSWHAASYHQRTIGSEGLKVKNVWEGLPGMDMVQQFSIGEIKTSYIINTPIDLPFTDGYMVIEDHFSLPDGYTFEQEKPNTNSDGQYAGNYLLKKQ